MKFIVWHPAYGEEVRIRKTVKEVVYLMGLLPQDEFVVVKLKTSGANTRKIFIDFEQHKPVDSNLLVQFLEAI